MTAFKCRVITPGGGDCLLPGGECDRPAAVGIVTEVEVDHIHDGKGDPPTVLQLHPVCADHAPESVHETRSSMAPDEWAVISLAYGVADGSLT